MSESNPSLDNAAHLRLSDPDVLLSILDNLPTSIFVKDNDLKFVFSNKLHCELIGKPEHELLGLGDADFYEEKVADAFLQNDRRVIDTGDVSIVEELASRKSGMTTPVLTRKARLQSVDGNTFLIGVNTDLTSLKKREDQYKALTETVPVGILQVEEDGTIAFSNPLLNAYCGGDGTNEARMRLVSRLQETHPHFPGQACKFETEIQGLGTEPRSVIVISSGWLSIGGDKRSAIISVIDVSEMMQLRRINEDVSRLNKELAANMRMLRDAQDELVKKGRMEQLGQLTATIAHELRNPLGAVRTSAFLLERKTKDKGLGIEQQIERINKGIVRCDNIITQLLDFSRTKQLQCQPGELDNWLQEVVEEEARKLSSKVSIELSLGLGGQQVPFDPSRLQRAVINMINNAAEAMIGQGDQAVGKDTVDPKITISTFCKDGYVSVRVVDNGPGFTPEAILLIREPLFTTKSFGTGLGIPAIEQIASQHGGRLDIASDPGKGASFTIWLPIKQSTSMQEVA